MARALPLIAGLEADIDSNDGEPAYPTTLADRAKAVAAMQPYYKAVDLLTNQLVPELQAGSPASVRGKTFRAVGDDLGEGNKNLRLLGADACS